MREKYYNRKRRTVNIKVKDLVLSVGSSKQKRKRGRRVTVNVDQVWIYHPRNSETRSYDSVNETTYEGKESSNWSNRSNSEKSRRSRKTSGNENKSCKSDKGNAGLEDLIVKRDRAVESTGTSERYDGKRPKICRKRSCRGSVIMNSREREKRLYCPKILPGSSNQGQTRRSNPPHQQSSRKTRMEADRIGRTRITHRGHSAAESGLEGSQRETLPVLPKEPLQRTRRMTGGAENRQPTTEQPQEKEPQCGSIGRRSDR
ncbi:hypothetical protein TNCV_3238341 [Trichonephila clavipes]|nr:hypothetical protein TNCV_3238341 [Trichonephila clavipes]